MCIHNNIGSHLCVLFIGGDKGFPGEDHTFFSYGNNFRLLIMCVNFKDLHSYGGLRMRRLRKMGTAFHSPETNVYDVTSCIL